MAVGIIDCQIAFKLGARTLRLDYRKVPLSAWIQLKAATGLTQQTLLSAVGQQDAEAFIALVWLERKQRERKLQFVMLVREYEDQDEEFDLVQITVDGDDMIPEDDVDDQEVLEGVVEGVVEDEDPTTGS